MLIVEEIWDEAKEIFGHCNEPKLFRWITDAVQLLANKGEVDPLVGYVDLCVDGRCITLPREVETPLAVNINGAPARGRDELFVFHLNGPGEHGDTCKFEWASRGSFVTYRDLKCPSRLVAFLDNVEDSGKKIRVFGFDDQNRPLRTKVGEVWEDGLLVPMIFGYALPASTDPVVSRITGIVKDVTVGNVRLSSFDNSTSTGILLGIFEPDETKPSYRRIKVSRDCEWVTVCYRKRSLEIRSLNDRIFLHSRPALILAMHALKKYREVDLALAINLEAQATRLLTERESVLVVPNSAPIQVSDETGIGVGARDDID